MTPLLRLGAASLVAGLLSATASAALTAGEVWTSLQARVTGMGATVTAGSQSTSGGTLALKNVTFAAPQPEGSATVTFPEIDLAEGGGNVTLTVPQTGKIAISGKNSKGGSFDLAMDVANSGLKSVISGAAGDMTYATTADTVTVSLASVSVDGQPVDAKLNVQMAGLSSTSHMTGTDPMAVDSQSSIQSVTLTVDGKDPKTTGTFHVDGSLSGLTSTAKLTVPKEMDPKNLAASLAAGYALASNVGYGETSFTFTTTTPKGPGKITGHLASGTVAVEMSKDHLQYGGTNTDLQVSIASPEMPFPSLDLTEKEGAFNLMVPVAKSDAPQDFGLLLKVVGLGLNNDVWSMIDPKGALPHDPATVIVDLSGTGSLGFDLFNPANAQTPPTNPGKLDSLDVKQLQVTVAGADLTGTGAMTFKNQGPVPEPVGKVDLKLTGGNGLLDKLIAMGLVPQDQAMGFKMMLGMFAKPAGDDVMTSEIEFKDDGSILANGQRIK